MNHPAETLQWSPISGGHRRDRSLLPRLPRSGFDLEKSPQLDSQVSRSPPLDVARADKSDVPSSFCTAATML